MEHRDNLEDLHADFNKGSLSEKDIESPFDKFIEWHQMAHEVKASEPDFMVVSTAIDNQPSSRGVYLRRIKNEGYVFFTNYESRKGNQIELNPFVSVVFFWRELERQIRIEGICSKVSEEESNAYFKARPRNSQLGAWASQQSQPVTNRAELEELHAYFDEKYPGEIPRPPHWGGYIIKPTYFEFWQGRPGRLHDRICCKLEKGVWKKYRIAP